jgi:hypothetical protein
MRNYCPLLRNNVRAAGVTYGNNDAYEDPQADEDQQQDEVPEENDGQNNDQPLDEEEEPNAVWLDEDDVPEYEFDELEEEHEEIPQEIGVRGMKCPDYESRRESLLNPIGQGPTIKVAAATESTAEPMYDHRSRNRDSPRPPRGHPNTKVFTIYMNVGGTLAHCLIDSGSEGVMISADYARATRLPMKKLEKPVTLQLACQGSKSMINHGITTKVDIGGRILDEYFDVANVDYYDVILGTPFLRRFGVKIDFAEDGEIVVGGKAYKSGSSISLTGAKTVTVAPSSNRQN